MPWTRTLNDSDKGQAPILTWHFSNHHFMSRGSDWDLEGRDVKGRHVILTPALIIVVDNILTDVVIRARVLDLCLSPPVVNNEDEDQN